MSVISKQLAVSGWQLGQNRRQDNEKVVFKSAVLAKALVKREDGRLEMIVVFHESTRYEFYWVFSVTSFWTPMRAWKKRNAYNRDSGVYQDFGSFVEWYAKMNKSVIKFLRISRMKTLASVLVKPRHESLTADWSPRVAKEVTLADVRLVQAQADKARKPRGFYFNHRNRAFDNLNSQDPNEVWVYEDWCEECMKPHLFAHFPNSEMNKCKIGWSEMKNNPAFRYAGYSPSTGFRYRYLTSDFVTAETKVRVLEGVNQ